MSDLLEIRESDSSGLGVFAKAPIRQGELVVEEITFKVDTSHLPGKKDTWRDVMLDMRNDNLPAKPVEDAIAALSKEQRDAFRATFKDAKSDLHRFQIISYDLCPVFKGPPGAFAATPIGPYLNHSCVANMQYSYDTASETVHLLALEDIAPGDQISICYMVDDKWMETKQRKKELHLIYDFDCACPLCDGSQRSVNSDRRRQVVRTLQHKLWTFIKSRGSDASFESISQDADKYIDFVEQELLGIDDATGLPHFADVRLADAYRLASKCKRDPKDAQKLRDKATRVSQICFGPDSPHVSMQDRLFEEQCQ